MLHTPPKINIKIEPKIIRQEIPRERVDIGVVNQQKTVDIQQYAERRCDETFGKGHYPALYQIITRESGWNSDAKNPYSTAYGLFQFLNSTWQGTGIQKTSDERQQVEAGLIYIQNRYGTPSNAWRFWQRNHWY